MKTTTVAGVVKMRTGWRSMKSEMRELPPPGLAQPGCCVDGLSIMRALTKREEAPGGRLPKSGRRSGLLLLRLRHAPLRVGSRLVYRGLDISALDRSHD